MILLFFPLLYYAILVALKVCRIYLYWLVTAGRIIRGQLVDYYVAIKFSSVCRESPDYNNIGQRTLGQNFTLYLEYHPGPLRYCFSKY